jgi:hypothetical protein
LKNDVNVPSKEGDKANKSRKKIFFVAVLKNTEAG